MSLILQRLGKSSLGMTPKNRTLGLPLIAGRESTPVFTASTNGAPQPESISRVRSKRSRSLDTVDVAQLSTPKLKNMDPYNSNHAADRHDYAQPGDGLGLPAPQESGEDALV